MSSISPVSEVRAGPLAVLRSPQCARVLAASLVGRLPVGAAPLALLVFGRETMTIVAAGLLVGAYTAGLAGGGPVLARWADRWRQPPVIWIAAAVSTTGFVVIASSVDLWVGSLGAVLAGAGAPPFEACLRVLWRDLLPGSLVHAAYSLDVAAQEMIFVVGPLVTIGAVAGFGPIGGLVAAAVLQLGGSAWFATARSVRRWRGEPAPRHWAGPLRSAALRIILVGIVLIGAGVGSIVVAAAGFASTAWAGWLLAAQAFGALVGGILYARRPVTDRLPVIATVMAVSYVLLVLTPAPPLMIVLMALSGLALPPLLTATFVTVDAVAPAGTAAEAFAWVITAFAVGSAAGSALDGVILDLSGSARVGFVLAPVVIALAAAVFTRVPRPAPAPAPAP